MASASPSTSKVPFNSTANKPKTILKRGKEYKTIKTKLKYQPLALVSPVTNRPIKDGETHPKIDVYWCEPCKKKLINPMAALQHFSSFQHTKNEVQAQKVKAKADHKRKYTWSTATATPAKVTSTATSTPAKVKKNIPPTPTKTHTTQNKDNKPKRWNYQNYSATQQQHNTNNQQRGGFNLSRSNDNFNPQSYAREHSNFTHPLLGNNYTWQQQQQFGTGLYNNNIGLNQQSVSNNNNIGLNQQSVSNLEMLQARLLRNQAELQAYQGQARGSFWRN